MFYHKMACSLCQGFYIKFKILNQFMIRRGMNIKRESRFLATEHFFLVGFTTTGFDKRN